MANQLANLMRPFDLLEDFNRAYGNLFNRSVMSEGDFSSEEWCPAADVKEEDGSFVVSMDVPGVASEDIEVTFQDGVLRLTGSRESEKRTEEDKMIRVERSSGSFVRQFRLPTSVDSDAIQARVKDGVLVVEVPKSAESKPKRITVG
jgi:HSP20 family protein